MLFCTQNDKVNKPPLTLAFVYCKRRRGDCMERVKRKRSSETSTTDTVKRGRTARTDREIIAWSQKWKCNVCKKRLPPRFDVDHIQPLSQKGPDIRQNMQAICGTCHQRKTAFDLSRVLQRRAALKRQAQTGVSIYFDRASPFCLLDKWKPERVQEEFTTDMPSDESEDSES